MKRLVSLRLLAFSALLLVAGQARAAINVDVTFGQAPNIYGSASYYPWTQNGIAALRSGLPAGTPNTPTYFQPITNFTPEMLIVSGTPSGTPSGSPYHSWNAQVDPGTVFGPAYSSEFGSRMALVTYISDSTGAQFDIASGIAVHRDNSPWRSTLDITYNTYSNNGGTSPTQPTRVGINWGADGIRGTGDDVVLTSGTGLVNEIFMFAPGMGDAEWLTGSEQDQLSNAVADIAARGPFQESFSVSFAGSEGFGVANVNSAVPEPASMIVWSLLGLAGIGFSRRRKAALAA
jgi:hypothetical protein